MISKPRPGSRTIGALAYLYGPGKANEHTDPHIVASWDGFTPDPGRDPGVTLTQLRDALDLHVVQYGKPVKSHVYHRPVRADPGDRVLSDEEWGEIARRLVTAAGIAPAGDPDGCRWIAVRHAHDHIHILATTVRADLTQANLWKDQYRVEDELTKIEHQYGLRSLADTRTREYRAAIPKRPTGAELRKAERLSLSEPQRVSLRNAVRQALAGAADEQEFIARLAAQGVLFDVRRAPSGDATGYKFALTGDVDGSGPLWFSGSKLAADLSRGKILARFAVGIDQPERQGPQSRPASGRRQASSTVDQALTTLTDTGSDADGRAAAIISGAVEVLDALAATSTTLTRKESLQAAHALERTGIAHSRAAHSDLRAMRSAARAILQDGSATGGGEEGAAAATILSSLVLLAILIAKWHAARGHEHQADAARAAAQHLRTAYARHAAAPLAVLDTEGRHLPQPVRDQQAETVRRALPADQATRLLAEDGWTALAATLAEAEAAGHDPQALLAQASSRRELATADSAAAVLTWRIRRDAGLPRLRQSGTRGPAQHALGQPPPTVPTPPRRSRQPRASPSRRRRLARGADRTSAVWHRKPPVPHS